MFCCFAFFLFGAKQEADYKICMKIQRIMAKYSLNKRNKIRGYIIVRDLLKLQQLRENTINEK